MNKKITLSVLLLYACTTLLTAQVGIGTTTPADGAILDVDSDSGGIMIPRVALTATNVVAPIISTLPTPEVGLLVYNTNTAGTAPNNVTPGFYFWNGIWERIASGASSDWSLTGNAGTTAGTNFIGTTDAQDIVIATNGTERMRVDASGNVGINTNAPAYKIHFSNNGVNIGATALTTSENTGNDGVSLFGYNNNSSNAFNAVEGVTSYNLSTFITSGVFGLAIANSGNGVGIRGASNSIDGYGVRGSRPSGPPGPGGAGLAGLFQGSLGYTGAFGAVSDIKTKKNIKQINNALDIISKINPVSYYFDIEKYPYLGLNSSLEYGFVSQEIQKILPEITFSKALDINATNPLELNNASNSKTENFLMLDYTRLIPILSKAIQEQQEIIDNQESRIGKLEALVNELLNKK